ncbi:MAG: AbrB/MazE/SpoVT family DNA-binding domain-containing protein [Salinigranum sp.]
MATEDTGETSDETVINDNYAATIPARVRDRIDVKPGDKLRWTATEDGRLRVEVVKQRYGVWDAAEPGHLGAVTEADIDAMGVDASGE